MKKIVKAVKTEDRLFSDIVCLIEDARKKVSKAVNLVMVYTNFEIGRLIVEHEQQGSHRAQYGAETLQHLSARLTEHFGKGYSYVNLRNIRQFYLVYSKSAHNLLANSTEVHFSLSRTHYLQLMRIKDK